MCAEPLHEAWATLDPLLVHVIQLLQFRLFTLFPLYLVKLLKIWYDFFHICIHVKHGIVPLSVHNKM
jgi:hypothetical protein